MIRRQKTVRYIVEHKGHDQTEHAWKPLECSSDGYDNYREALATYKRYGGCQKRIRKNTTIIENEIVKMEL